MKIGIIGGTGAMGKGFAMRWSKNHHIMIGSRDAGRAAESAASYTELARSYGISGKITGSDNITISRDSDVLVLSIPYENIDTVCPGVLDAASQDCIVISPIVPMEKTKTGFEFIPFRDKMPGSHELVSQYMKNPENLVSAFHVISEKKLANPELILNYDIFVCGDGDEACKIVGGLTSEISALRPIYLGPGSLAYMAEIATPLLLNAMIRNKLKNPGIKLV